MASHPPVIQDALYGQISQSEEIAMLSSAPLVQRLRHVRLSNIDSFDMPGISNLSRFEHVVGVAHLATTTGLTPRLNDREKLVLQAGALLHDWAITAFGHLVEEALQYVGTGFNHELRLHQIVSGDAPEEIGGVNRQIIGGRETGLRKWAIKVCGSPIEADKLILDIRDNIFGQGLYGKIISGDIDLDNSDNLFRIGWHMGLSIDRETPLRLASAMVGVDQEAGAIVFSERARTDIGVWCDVRDEVYSHLMLAHRDFAAKIMVLHATVSAFEVGDISIEDWGLNDNEFVQKLRSSTVPQVKDTVTRWLVGELWNITPLVWMAGQRPQYTEVRAFSERLSQVIDRPCFAYAIKDKRNRALRVRFENGARQDFGMRSDQWLLGVGSPLRKPFNSAQVKRIFDAAASYFSSEVRTIASSPSSNDQQPCLL